MALSTAACSSASSKTPAPLTEARGGSDSASARKSGQATAIRFEDASLASDPGSVHSLVVRVEPPGNYTVRLALVGDARDAALDLSDAPTDDNGEAAVSMTAPSSAASYTLRASVDTLVATLPVSVAEAFTTLQVVPSYAGKRPITSWIATVQTHARCDPAETVPPSDGPLLGEATGGLAPAVENVPVGPSLRVTVRAGQFVGGCAELPNGVPSERASVSIPVTDRPLQTAQLEVPL